MEEIVIDPATGEYVRLVDGKEVARWQPLAGLSAGSSGPSPGTTTIGPDGRAVAPSTPPLDPLTQQPKVAAETAAPATPWYDDGYSGGGRSGGYTRRSSGGGSYGGYASGGFRGPGYDGGVGSSGGSFGGTVPRYADNTTHPYFGGGPRTPGGIFAQQDDGYDDRVQVTASSGATAGPFEVSAAPAPDAGSYGVGGGSSGGSGGGGLARDMISRIRGNVMGKVSGMGPGGESGSTDPTAAYRRQQQQYRQQGRRIDRASDRYNEALGEPLHLPVRGWAKRQGYKPGSIDALLSSPGSILADVFDGIDLNTATDPLTDLPMTDLAMLTFGARGKKLTSKTPVVDVPGILKRQAGYEQPKPEFPRTLDPSKAVNKIALMYRQLATGQRDLDTENLLGNLAHTKKKSALGVGLAQQAKYDPGGALGQIGNYVHAAYAPLGDTGWTRAMHAGIDRELMERGGVFARKKPEKVHRAARQIGRSFL